MDKAATDKMCQAVIIQAVEGGTGYWASVSDYHHEDPAKTTATLYEILPDESGYSEEGMVLDQEAVLRGMDRIISGEAPVHDSYRQVVAAMRLLGDHPAWDSDIDDYITQAGLLGEVRYS